MDLGIEGKAFVISGGTDGLGLAAARRLATEGARVAVLGRNSMRLQNAELSLSRFPGSSMAVRADVTKVADMKRAVDIVLDRWGSVDGLINNAGRSMSRHVDDVDDQMLQDDLELKLFGALRLSRLLIPHLADVGGSILNVLSTDARAVRPASLPTAASRSAGLALTKVMAHDLAPSIRVNAVLVGLVMSGQWLRRAEAAGHDIDEFARCAAVEAGIPLGRIGYAEEFADIAAFLLSPRAGYVTGAAVNVDGGLSPVP